MGIGKPLEGNRTPLHRGRRQAPPRQRGGRAHIRLDGGAATLARPAGEGADDRAGHAQRKSSGTSGARGIARALLQRLAGRGRCQSGRRNVSRSKSLSSQQRPRFGRAAQQRARASRSDRVARRARRRTVVFADRRRRRGRVRRGPQRLRADEEFDSLRRGRRALRRSVELGKKSVGISAARC